MITADSKFATESVPFDPVAPVEVSTKLPSTVSTKRSSSAPASRKSSPAPPVIVSLPVPPLTLSLPAPARITSAPDAPVMLSLPLPPSIVSLPPPPTRTSSPSSPVIESLPVLVRIVSLPSPPVTVTAIGPVSRFPTLTLSLPAPALIVSLPVGVLKSIERPVPVADIRDKPLLNTSSSPTTIVSSALLNVKTRFVAVKFSTIGSTSVNVIDVVSRLMTPSVAFTSEYVAVVTVPPMIRRVSLMVCVPAENTKPPDGIGLPLE